MLKDEESERDKEKEKWTLAPVTSISYSVYYMTVFFDSLSELVKCFFVTRNHSKRVWLDPTVSLMV